VNAVLHEGGRGDAASVGRHRVRSVLVVAQVAGSLMLLVVAGLFVRSLKRAEHMDLGFDPDHVLNVTLDAGQIGYDHTRAKAFYRELKRRVRAMPGVETVSLAFTVPLFMPGPDAPVYVEGCAPAPDQSPPVISFNGVDANYFGTMRVPLLQGRTFTNFDNETAQPVAIVNQTMANRFWPNEDPIGKRFSLKSASGPFVEVVGLARDGQSTWRLSPEPQPFFYVPVAQHFTSSLSLQVRSSVPPESLVTRVQGEIRKLAPDLPILNAWTMQETVHGLAGFFMIRLAASLAGVMGLLGLTLAVVGVYGVVSFSVSRRTHEIGIRMALGAERLDILRLTLREGLGLVILGVIAGLAVAWALTRAMSKLLIGVSPSDPATYLIVALLLSAVALLACYIPARRATKVDPMVALRYE
jgi:predicted permease